MQCRIDGQSLSRILERMQCPGGPSNQIRRRGKERIELDGHVTVFIDLCILGVQKLAPSSKLSSTCQIQGSRW
jgi:hypothetical protein